jgi:hypothetical protein
LVNVSEGIPCSPSCDGEASQLDTIRRVKAANPNVAVGFYQNSLYAWSFQKLTGEFAEANLLMRATNGSVIGLEQDNGLKHQPVFDLSDPKGVDKWLNWTSTLVNEYGVDGIFMDKPNVFPITNKTADSWELCEGPHGPMSGHAWAECCALIPEPAAANYTTGKNRLLQEVKANFNKASAFITSTSNGTMRFIGSISRSNVKALLSTVKDALADEGSVYLASTDQHSDWDPTNTTSQCTDEQLAKFMLVVEEGAFVGCNGNDARFDLPLGNPTGPAVEKPASHWTRSFSSGTQVWYDESTHNATISWGKALA